jgi:hypothetical protein
LDGTLLYFYSPVIKQRGMDREADKKEPTVAQQIAFIMENHQILDRKTKIQILNIVWLEAESPDDVLGADDTNGVDVDLDACAEKYPDVIRPIYNLVLVRRRTLNQPAREKIDGGLNATLSTDTSSHVAGPRPTATVPVNKTGTALAEAAPAEHLPKKRQ